MGLAVAECVSLNQHTYVITNANIQEQGKFGPFQKLFDMADSVP